MIIILSIEQTQLGLICPQRSLLSVMLMCVESEHHRLTNREIIFEEFQPVWLITIPQRHGQTDGQTVKQLAVAIGEIAYKWCRLKTHSHCDQLMLRKISKIHLCHQMSHCELRCVICIVRHQLSRLGTATKSAIWESGKHQVSLEDLQNVWKSKSINLPVKIQ